MLSNKCSEYYCSPAAWEDVCMRQRAGWPQDIVSPWSVDQNNTGGRGAGKVSRVAEMKNTHSVERHEGWRTNRAACSANTLFSNPMNLGSFIYLSTYII